jgi:hypothetical protein
MSVSVLVDSASQLAGPASVSVLVDLASRLADPASALASAALVRLQEAETWVWP